MCELLAVNAAKPVVVNEYLDEFFSHSERNPHGWGLSWREKPAADHAEAASRSPLPHIPAGPVNASVQPLANSRRRGTSAISEIDDELWDDDSTYHIDGVKLYKEPIKASDSQLLAELTSKPIAVENLVAHIRRATHGICAHCNCHPFHGVDISGTDWIMAHNGIVMNESLLAGYDVWENGETDSERVMMFLLDVLEEATLRCGRPLTFEERFHTLEGAIGQLSNGNKLNLILDDGEHTFIHTNTREYTLFMLELDGYIVVSTNPLGDGAWTPVPQRRLIALHDGEVIAASSAHDMGFSDNFLHRLMGRPLT